MRLIGYAIFFLYLCGQIRARREYVREKAIGLI